MICIEKLKTTHSKPQLTLVDLLHNDNTSGENYLGIYPATHALKPIIESKLCDITIGNLYGPGGININDLLAESKDIVVETTYQTLLALPATKQVRLLTNYTIILSDLEEGGAFFGYMGPCLIEHLEKLGVIPKKIYVISPGINQLSNSKFNIESVYMCTWAVFTMLNDPYYIGLLFDEEARGVALDKIKHNQKTVGLCLNKKPRYNRVKCLAELDRRNILGLFDWTLLYSKEPLGTEEDYGHFIKSPNNFRFNEQLDMHSDASMKAFLEQHSLPRLMSNSKQETFGDSIGASPDWLGKYKYYISNETYCEYKPTSLGSTGFLTEKTFKSMCIGAYPFVIGVPGSEKKLSNLGFKLLEQDYDSLEGVDRIYSVCDAIEKAIKSNYDVTEIVAHNFNLIANVDFLAGLVAGPINQMFQPS